MSWFRWAKPLTHKVSGDYAQSPFLRGATMTSRAPAFILPPANGISDPGRGYLGITIVADHPAGTTNPRAGRVVQPRGQLWHPLV